MVFPSEWYENLPYSVMESLALGVPVLASRMGGVPEIIEEGTTGWLFEPGNVDELRRRISHAFENPLVLAGMRPAARKAAEFTFDPGRNYRVLEHVYAGLNLNPNQGRKE
jgi:glycosyltransferase involved in cell wall biosynthesis